VVRSGPNDTALRFLVWTARPPAGDGSGETLLAGYALEVTENPLLQTITWETSDDRGYEVDLRIRMQRIEGTSLLERVIEGTLSARGGLFTPHGRGALVDDPLGEPAAPTPDPARAPGRVELPTTVRESGDGEFDSALVVRAIASRESALDDCYEIARGESPDVGGPLTVRIVAQESGAVAPVQILEGTIGESGDACVLGVFERIRFSPGPFDGPMTYVLTLRFSPGA
jgi:hypothetical protein